MYLATSNIRDNPDLPRPSVVSAARITSHMLPIGGVACFQEIGEVQDHEDVRTGMGAGWQHLFEDNECHVAVSHTWRAHDMHAHRISTGHAHVTPDRYANGVLLTHRTRRHLDPIAVVNTHWVSGAFSKPGQPGDDGLRKQIWEQNWEATRDLVLGYYRKGLVTFFLGDLNRIAVPEFHKSQRWLVGHGSIDKIAVLVPPKTNTVELLKTLRQPTPSDHDAKAVEVSLHRPGV